VRPLRALVRFWLRDEHGQDLSDYCLLTALVALIALAVFVHVSGGIQNIWNIGNGTLASGNSVAGGAGSSHGSSGEHH
jgi:Flp pilus assembly pilin Flp